jgi:G3E family GTPase
MDNFGGMEDFMKDRQDGLDARRQQSHRNIEAGLVTAAAVVGMQVLHHQKQQEKAQFRAWLASLSPEQRAQVLRKQGIARRNKVLGWGALVLVCIVFVWHGIATEPPDVPPVTYSTTP